ncbi:hypothetical protein AB0M45_33160 [Nocardia sp. NPDC051787]|uniref:hypothetical protein n=1 Tax=Nocardia sp. NPDC051787 TaxID=3155415 RepID=UPI0034425538
MLSDSQSPEHFVVGITPNTPRVFTIPAVEAQPDQPLRDAGPYLRKCAGGEETTTTQMRCARALVGARRDVHEHGRRDSASVDEQINFLIWLIDRGAGGHTCRTAFAPDAPTSPSSYGDSVAWLMWKYVMYAPREHNLEHHERGAAQLAWCIEAFDQLVADVRTGWVRLPEQATAVFPLKTIRPSAAQSDMPDGGEGQVAH